MPVQNAEVASIFDQTADLLEIQGGNEFRARAYRRAAHTIERLPHSAESMMTADEKLRRNTLSRTCARGLLRLKTRSGLERIRMAKGERR